MQSLEKKYNLESFIGNTRVILYTEVLLFSLFVLKCTSTTCLALSPAFKKLV